MKILHVTKKFENKIYGGIESLIDSLCNSFNNSKANKSDVYTIKKNKVKSSFYKVFSDNLSFEFLSCPVSFSSFFTFIRLCKSYDVINFHFPWPFMDVLSLFIPRSKILITYHSDIIQRNIFYYFYYPFLIFFLYRSKKIVVTSRNYLKSSNILKFFVKKIVIIPIGVSDKKKEITCHKNIYFKKYFVFIGTFRKYKGLEYLINSFNNSRLNLIIIGNGGNEYESLGGFSKNIKILNKVNNSQKLNILNKSLGLILPSIDRRESYGIVLVEGLSLGKALITTELFTGTSFVNVNKKTGYVIKPKVTDQIIKACEKLKNNYELRKNFEKNSRSRYLKIFTLKKMIKKYQKVYKLF